MFWGSRHSRTLQVSAKFASGLSCCQDYFVELLLRLMLVLLLHLVILLMLL